MRKGRYSKKFLLSTDLQREIELESLFPQFQTILTKDKNPEEIVGNYIKLIWQHRHQSKWLGSKNYYFSPINIDGKSDEFLCFWSTQVLRSLPFKINQVLINWRCGIIPIELIHYTPSAEEILNYQCQGKRCVTLLKTENEWRSEVEHNRDVFSFLIHDILHAYEFFLDNNQLENQISFYHFLKNNLSLLRLLTLNYPQLQLDLDYLCSDMNSHPNHLLNTFLAIINQLPLNPNKMLILENLTQYQKSLEF